MAAILDFVAPCLFSGRGVGPPQQLVTPHKKVHAFNCLYISPILQEVLPKPHKPAGNSGNDSPEM